MQPKIILQSLPTNGVEVAAWTDDDRYIITAVGSTRSVAIWEVETGHIIDRFRIPAEPGRTGALLRLSKLELAEDGRTAILEGVSARVISEDNYTEPKKLRYEFDLNSRDFTGISTTDDPQLEWDITEFEVANDALETVFENSDDWTIDEAQDYLLELPTSHNGEWTLERRATPSEGIGNALPQGGLILTSAVDGTQIELLHEPMQKFDSASLSSDGRWLAMTNDKMDTEYEGGPDVSLIEIYDTQTAYFEQTVRIVGDYNRIQWVTEDQFLVTQISSNDDVWRDGLEGRGPPPEAVIVNARGGKIEDRIESRCFMTVLPSGGYIGAGTSNCRVDNGGSLGLERYDPSSRTWSPFGPPGLEGEGLINLIAVSPDGSRLAVTTFEAEFEYEDENQEGVSEDEDQYEVRDDDDDDDDEGEPDDEREVDDEDDEEIALFDESTIKITGHIVDTETGELQHSRTLDGLKFNSMMSFTPDGKSLLVSGNGEILQWRLDEDEWASASPTSLDTTVLTRHGDLLAVAGEADDAVGIYDFDSGEELQKLEFASVTAGGFFPDAPLFWAFSADEGLRFWDTRNWSIVLTSYFFDNQGFLAVTPEGRYDSNIHPYEAKFRWLVPDQPFTSLNPDAFSRDYYAPGLTERWIKCSVARNCAESFEALRPIAELDLNLPEVEIVSVEEGENPAQAIVTLEISNPAMTGDSGNGLTAAVFDPRIFRNHQLVYRQQGVQIGGRESVENWRSENRLDLDNAEFVEGRYRLRATVSLPTGDEPHEQFPLISAYVFNADRIKSETDEFEYQRPEVEPLQPKAFVITFGIDHYEEQRLNLNFAGNDARLMGERLANMPGYETRRLTIHSIGPEQAPAGDGLPSFVSPEIFRDVFTILAEEDSAAAMGNLASQGIDASALERAGPDDLVIISYAGHGWTDPLGEFYLATSQASWADADGSPKLDGLISSMQLADWLSNIDAGAMTLIIDACHSAASVENGSFKPGPLGDPGLGQLAFDKGVRVLTATQADDVALEDANLRQGLLTYVLAGEGLSSEGDEADFDGDGLVEMTEWLDYAVLRLPELQVDARVDGVRSASVVFHDIPDGQVEKKVQEPSLFDFVIDYSPIVLRSAAP